MPVLPKVEREPMLKHDADLDYFPWVCRMLDEAALAARWVDRMLHVPEHRGNHFRVHVNPSRFENCVIPSRPVVSIRLLLRLVASVRRFRDGVFAFLS